MTEYMDMEDVATVCKLTIGTVRQYRGSGRLPAEDKMYGATPVWKPATITKWNDERTKR